MPLVPPRNPRVLFRVLVASVVLVVAAGTIVTLETTGSLSKTAGTASERAETAQLAAEASDRLREMDQITERRVTTLINSPEITDLTETQQQAVVAWLNAETESPPSDSIANLSVPLSLKDAVDFQAAVDYLNNRLALLFATVDTPELRLASAQVGQVVQRSIDRYFVDPTLANLHDLQIAIKGLQSYTAGEIPRLSAEAVTLREDLLSSVLFLRWAVIALGVGGGLSILVLAYYMSRTTQRLLLDARQEQDELADLTRSLEYRNEQLNALYNVFNEITDTLSLRYVVRATMFESLRIMRADMAVLRILRGNDLEVAGAMTGEGTEIEGLPPVALGEGPTGRTAKRGRTLRIDEGGERMMAPPDVDENAEGAPSRQAGMRGFLESGLIVPLIVGARVVGTLSCWSGKVSAFSEGDERILEMMASQVATAIVAADTTEKSENRALHDPLTNLPNRRQLDEDIAGRLSVLVHEERAAVVAMIDIDHFKHFNDEYGHRVGDITLQKVASVLRSSARDNDLVYRYGGEEFVVVFEDSRAEDALMLADRLRLAVESAPLSGEDLNPVGPLTISIGLAFLPQHGTDLGELIGLADKAMYRAKANGRNRVEVWADEPDKASTRAA